MFILGRLCWCESPQGNRKAIIKHRGQVTVPNLEINCSPNSSSIEQVFCLLCGMWYSLVRITCQPSPHSSFFLNKNFVIIASYRLSYTVVLQMSSSLKKCCPMMYWPLIQRKQCIFRYTLPSY